MILTDAKGKPFAKPQRADFDNDVDFMRARNAWRDAITKLANDAFTETFRAAIGR